MLEQSRNVGILKINDSTGDGDVDDDNDGNIYIKGGHDDRSGAGTDEGVDGG